MVIPDFEEFTEIIEELYEEVKEVTGGKVRCQFYPLILHPSIVSALALCNNTRCSCMFFSAVSRYSVAHHAKAGCSHPMMMARYDCEFLSSLCNSLHRYQCSSRRLLVPPTFPVYAQGRGLYSRAGRRSSTQVCSGNHDSKWSAFLSRRLEGFFLFAVCFKGGSMP